MSQWIAVALAIASAVCLAVGTQTQSSAVTDHTSGALNPRNLGKLLRNGRWLLGTGLLGLGMLLNVCALALATVTVVQPLGVIALVITTLLHARRQRLTINRRTWLAVALCTAGGAGFVVCAVTGTDPSHVPGPRAENLVVLVLVGLVALIGVAELVLRRRHISMFYVLSAGVLYGFVAVLVRLTTTALRYGGIGAVHWLSVLMVLVAAVLGGWLVQYAYSCGPPDLVIAGLTVVDPMVGVALGLVVLGEAGARFTGALGAVMGLAGLVAIVGVVLLSQCHPEVIERRAAARARREGKGSGARPRTARAQRRAGHADQ
ncbi:DMT family transporter [Kocuria rhizophila]|uniref:DMT family transporter n=1 Tax=Kocuria rhizophila TaxID=72000 RepID=UPI001D7B00A2|nr:DMT family transporter [Kocuria rhizophila]MCC5671010.1 DMT family transporter [Kocuria rhizophila]MCC5674156.1 DMT family transporter [Kocuria rhizophila]